MMLNDNDDDNELLPVYGDDHQVPHWGVARQVVDGQPGVAQVAGKRPLLQKGWIFFSEFRKYFWFLYLHDGHDSEERHGDGADNEVRHGEREQEVVGDGLQLLVYLERYHHLEWNPVIITFLSSWVISITISVYRNVLDIEWDWKGNHRKWFLYWNIFSIWMSNFLLELECVLFQRNLKKKISKFIAISMFKIKGLDLNFIAI